MHPARIGKTNGIGQDNIYTLKQALFIYVMLPDRGINKGGEL